MSLPLTGVGLMVDISALYLPSIFLGVSPLTQLSPLSMSTVQDSGEGDFTPVISSGDFTWVVRIGPEGRGGLGSKGLSSRFPLSSPLPLVMLSVVGRGDFGPPLPFSVGVFSLLLVFDNWLLNSFFDSVVSVCVFGFALIQIFPSGFGNSVVAATALVARLSADPGRSKTVQWSYGMFDNRQELDLRITWGDFVRTDAWLLALGISVRRLGGAEFNCLPVPGFGDA